LREGDPTGRWRAAQSPSSRSLRPRTSTADRVVDSICPYCAVGCGQKVYVRDGEILQIEGHPDSPISRGKLCPKGAATRQLVTGPHREYQIKYRRPYGTSWEALDLDTAMDMIAERVIENRRTHWQDSDADGNPLRRTMG